MKDESAVCRGCGRLLNGTPYHKGGPAYIPETNERAKVNHYGGYVCSESCDRSSSKQLEGSMPGCRYSDRLSCFAEASLKSNWSNDHD